MAITCEGCPIAGLIDASEAFAEAHPEFYKQADQRKAALGLIAMQRWVINKLAAEISCPGRSANEGKLICPLLDAYQQAMGGIPGPNLQFRQLLAYDALLPPEPDARDDRAGNYL